MSIVLPPSSTSDVSKLTSVFNNVNQCYKFYWFMAILDLYKTNCRKNASQAPIAFSDLVLKMISLAWYPVHYYKLKLDFQGALSSSVIDIQRVTNIPIDCKEGQLYPALLAKKNELNPFTNKLLNYVPYRFLNPWLNLKESAKSLFESESQKFSNNCLYAIIRDPKTSESAIVLNDDWHDYLQAHQGILKDYVDFHLVEFLEKYNPNVPNLIAKIHRPEERSSLDSQHKYFDEFVSMKSHQANGQLACIFGNTEFIDPQNYALDHFIPWSFVCHNLVWNLVPITPSINSSKSNNLPDLNLYLSKFTEFQHECLDFNLNTCVGKTAVKKCLEDYLIFGMDLKSLNSLSNKEFYDAYLKLMQPLHQIASNMGFLPW